MLEQAEIRNIVESYGELEDSFLTEAVHNTARAMVEKSLDVQHG